MPPFFTIEVNPMEDKALVMGYVTLLIGVGLLAFTFASAFLFLSNDPNIRGSADLVVVFGDALAPLIVTCIRIMYLGVMGWIGSVLTIRGVQLVTRLKLEAKPEIEPEVPTTLNPTMPKTTEIRKAKKTREIRKI